MCALMPGLCTAGEKRACSKLLAACSKQLAEAGVRKLPAEYDMEGLVRELAAGTVT